MIIFTDAITGDELCSDAFKLEDVGGVLVEVNSQMITIKEGEVDIGANASAEEQTEELADGAQTVNNLVHTFRLQSTTFDKKSYLTYLKGYMKSVKAHLQSSNPDRVAAFEKEAQEAAKKIVANFKDYEFFVGESMNPDGMVALLNYREDGTTPYFSFWKDGLKETKV
ncbi:translationally-controlled tumor protein [Phakopsora pachyrhizi]|nr:translationally-controlled tumor protein [Phakopsora pachyrhizi]